MPEAMNAFSVETNALLTSLLTVAMTTTSLVTDWSRSWH